MKDKLISTLVFVGTGLIVVAFTRDLFLTFADTYKLVGGFIKFFVLATIGDVISVRLKTGRWALPKKLLSKAIVWGCIGVVIVLIFGIFKSGVAFLQAEQILPFAGSSLATAFFISVFMNLTFAPTMMAFHRITDTYFDLRFEGSKIRLFDVVDQVDWSMFVRKVLLITIPFFWIPAHTITFMLPDTYQVIFAAVLGIFLGLLLGFFGKQAKS